MKIEPVVRAAQILRSQPACTMSLRELHARLQAELGADAGTYAEIHYQLKHRPQSFVMLDTPQLLRGTDAWPAQVREEYRAALEEAGLGACVRVALAEADADPAQDGAVAIAGLTVSELWGLAAGDAVLHETLSAAAHELEEIGALLATDGAAARPTIPPPDPRPRAEDPRRRPRPGRRRLPPRESRPG